ncbi:hypothetical protein BDP27DRAFT_1319861 [Rhodocollybia butyracea]|uniref:Secreted protein n=1 Tax=Rhodocollybia butyracea TaxID=206335 RepID=A0A9P5PUM2_9AGAR|nr:hypothetical protein BDP27DRAFT_1319861 [Rhodocollybia butyracea]
MSSTLNAATTGALLLVVVSRTLPNKGPPYRVASFLPGAWCPDDGDGGRAVLWLSLSSVNWRSITFCRPSYCSCNFSRGSHVQPLYPNLFVILYIGEASQAAPQASEGASPLSGQSDKSRTKRPFQNTC